MSSGAVCGYVLRRIKETPEARLPFLAPLLRTSPSVPLCPSSARRPAGHFYLSSHSISWTVRPRSRRAGSRRGRRHRGTRPGRVGPLSGGGRASAPTGGGGVRPGPGRRTHCGEPVPRERRAQPPWPRAPACPHCLSSIATRRRRGPRALRGVGARSGSRSGCRGETGATWRWRPDGPARAPGTAAACPRSGSPRSHQILQKKDLKILWQQMISLWTTLMNS
ncbi:translation initiation factor IF-2-like [Lutra lutra]|uniref:translation initiation factor IF-2-like n=1 Tax=Lutra lutra TaxID=9657 RepID=UPI001FD2AD50|nr:translation initiation factor IF-2-like [Lutra lutra]